MTDKYSQSSTKEKLVSAVGLAKIAIFTAIICVLAVISFPIGDVPVTLGLLGVFLTAVLLNPFESTTAVFVYILLGAIGLPVFSKFQSGFAVLAGPTGGYIYSYLLTCLIISTTAYVVRKKVTSTVLRIVYISLAFIVGTLVCYALGTIQFMIVLKKSLAVSLGACVYPFIPFDIAKAVLAIFLGEKFYPLMQKMIRR